jgi:hypothetical protein
MLGMEQLHHAQVHFATAAEALFKQSMRTKIHIRPRQSAEGLRFCILPKDEPFGFFWGNRGVEPPLQMPPCGHHQKPRITNTTFAVNPAPSN